MNSNTELEILGFSTKPILTTEIGYAPLIEETVSIEFANALSGAEIGLRGFRNRTLFRRLWEGFTGEGKERLSAVIQDVIVSQRASNQIVQILGNELIRTKKFNIVTAKFLKKQHEKIRKIVYDLKFLQELVSNLNDRVIDFENRLSSLDYEIERANSIRRINSFFSAGKLHPGIGTLIGASFYLTIILNYFENEKESVIRDEKKAALAEISKYAGEDTIRIDEVLSSIYTETNFEMIEPLQFIFENIRSPLSTMILEVLRQKEEHRDTEKVDMDSKINKIIKNAKEEFTFSTIYSPISFSKIISNEIIQHKQNQRL